jgi:RHS repeat-associated protein
MPFPAKSRTTTLGPFGEVIRNSGPLAKNNPLRFSTKYQDDESDLLYFGYRYYKASTGAWLSRDLIQEKGGFNLFEFVANDPVSRRDTLGRFPNPISPPTPPPNNINPPPTGPFSKCDIGLQCETVVLGQTHCGLVIDTGSGVYDMDGSGGTINQIYLVPGSTSDATGPMTSYPSSVCECLLGRIQSWNQRKVPRCNTCQNSNWSLKCALNKCGLTVNWGSRPVPLGYNCKVCADYGAFYGGPACPAPSSCCKKWIDAPCPDQ